jgi:hypothetical protein
MPKVLNQSIKPEVMNDELNRVIIELVAVVLTEDRENERKAKLYGAMSESLEQLAGLAECKVKRRVLTQIKKRLRAVLQGSTNKLLIAAIGGDN